MIESRAAIWVWEFQVQGAGLETVDWGSRWVHVGSGFKVKGLGVQGVFFYVGRIRLTHLRFTRKNKTAYVVEGSGRKRLGFKV